MSALELGIDFQMPKNQSSQIKVMGIGGGGSNAVITCMKMELKELTLLSITDAQALEAAPVQLKFS